METNRFDRDLYNDLDGKDREYLKPEEILNKIEELDGKTPEHLLVRDQALIAFLYLTAARIQEIVPYSLEPYRNEQGELVREEKEHIGNALKKNKIEDFGDHVIVRDVRCLKRTKPGKEKGKLKRNIPILNWKIEQPFLVYLMNYLKTIKEDFFIFPFTRQRAWQILDKVGLHPHQLRHLRLTHMTQRYWFSPNDLKRFVGWTNTAPASTYVHLDTTDLIKKMRDRAEQIDKEEVVRD